MTSMSRFRANGRVATDLDGNRLRLAQPTPTSTPNLERQLGTGVEDELVALKRAMWDKVTRRDRAWMAEHLTADFTECGLSGRVYDRAAILDGDRLIG